MKIWITTTILILVLYAAHHLLPKTAVRTARRKLGRHAPRVALLVTIMIMLLIAAWSFPSLKLL